MLKRMLLRPLPVMAMQPVFSRIIRFITKEHPRIFARLGQNAEKTFLIRPTDMPFVLFLKPNPANPKMFARRSEKGTHFDASISGEFMHLVKLLEAREDGDALFFSRDLVVEGDTEAVVCLRNAMDDMDGNVIDEAARAFGKPGITGLKLLRKIEDIYNDFAGQKA